MLLYPMAILRQTRSDSYGTSPITTTLSMEGTYAKGYPCP